MFIIFPAASLIPTFEVRPGDATEISLTVNNRVFRWSKNLVNNAQTSKTPASTCITDSWTVLILHEMNVPACGSVSFVFMFWLINGKPNIRCYTTLTIKKILRHSLDNTECAAGNGHHALFQTTTTTTANLGTPRGLEPRLVLLPKGEVVTITGILNHVIYIYSRNFKKNNTIQRLPRTNYTFRQKSRKSG